MNGKIIHAFALTAVAVFLVILAGCSKIGDIKVTSFSVDSFSPKGLRGADATLSLAIENPAMEFSLSDIQGVVYYKGKEYVDYSAEPITVNGKCAAVYPLNCSASLRPDISLVSVLTLVRDYNIDDFSTTISAKVRLRSGVGKKLKFKNIPLKKLLE